MAINSIISSYLSASQQKQLVLDLAADIKTNHKELLECLEVFGSTDDILPELLPLCYNYAQETIFCGDFSTVVDLCVKLPQLLDQVSKWLVSILTNTLASSWNMCFTHNLHQFSATGEPSELSQVAVILSFLEAVSLKTNVSSELDNIIILLMTSYDEDLSSAATKLIRYRINDIIKCEGHLWDYVKYLLEGNKSFHIKSGYVTWLRYLINCSEPSPSFLQFLGTEEYWNILQAGLTDAHEVRKYCISILKLSLKYKSTTDEELEAWKKFVTLYEIVGIDTALNQFQAAKNDVLELLNNKNLHPSWGLNILSTGFKASMESVRKFTLSVLFEVKDKSILKYSDLDFMQFAMQASHFKSADNCPYGTTVSHFVTEMIEAQSCEEDKNSMVTRLLDLLVEMRFTFDPARIYVSMGVLRALDSLTLSQTHLASLIKLFEVEGEENVFEHTAQLINLKMLSHVSGISTEEFVQACVTFVKFNSYKMLIDNLDFLRRSESTKIDLSTCEVQFQVVYFLLFGECQINQAFLMELSRAGVSHEKYSDLLKSLTSNCADSFVDSHYLAAFAKDKYDLSVLYDSLCSSFDLDKFQFFSVMYPFRTNDLDVLKLNEMIPKLPHKEADEVISYMLRMLSTSCPIELLQKSVNRGYKCNTVISEIIDELLNSSDDVDTLVDILQEIWENVSSERLVLNQKSLHLALIKTFMNHTLLERANSDIRLQEVLINFIKEIIEQAYSRRTFLPIMSKQLSTFTTPGAWLINPMINLFTAVQMSDNIFTLKPVIAGLYDSLRPGSSLYQSVYGDDELSTQVNIINALISCDASFKKEFVNQTLNTEDPLHLLVAKKKTDGVEQRFRLLVFQLLLCLAPMDVTVLIPSLLVEHNPLVRICMEWIIALSMSPEDLETHIFPLLEDHSKPATCVSGERICYLVLQSLPEPSVFLNKFLSYLILNCTSNKPLIRHFSNSLMLSLYPRFSSLVSDSTLLSVLHQLFLDAKKLEVEGPQYRTGDALIWDLAQDNTLTSIFGGVLLKVTDHDIPYISANDFSKYLSYQGMPIGEDETGKWLAKRGTTVTTVVESGSGPLQTKSGAWETVMDIDNEATPVVKRSELIVVSSLVDKPPNLGGICRLCDVLGVGLMTVNDMRVKQHPQFKNVAVTADKWMPMTEVKIEDIVSFLHEKKREGYTLIGLEQTDKSMELSTYTFPSKSLILLGIEAHGIPGYLLSELDLCLEIKQSGVIRSMNIQTATAVIVHSYSVQHM